MCIPGLLHVLRPLRSLPTVCSLFLFPHSLSAVYYSSIAFSPVISLLFQAVHMVCNYIDDLNMWRREMEINTIVRIA